MYTLEREQRVAASMEQAWDFLQNPANLDRITPADLRFRIVSTVPAIMFNGLIVEYRITIPWAGTHSWVTEIKHIREGHSFVDEQRLGPYRFWYHYHEIREDNGQVVLIDTGLLSTSLRPAGHHPAPHLYPSHPGADLRLPQGAAGVLSLRSLCVKKRQP